MSGNKGHIESLARQIAQCRLCVDAPCGKPLPHAPRPVCVLSRTARIAICGQAPGTRVHQSGRPFTDPSGDRLRGWMGLGDDVFYDASRIAIIPMGFCFPGLDSKGSDLPPRRECAKAWHARVFGTMPQLELVLVIGQYAKAYHLPHYKRHSQTATIESWREIYNPTAPRRYIPLPHPSWRNNAWLKKHPWFSGDLLPVLRAEIATLINPVAEN